jgi:glycosyltransferase involved in cell wall biosynthesis
VSVSNLNLHATQNHRGSKSAEAGATVSHPRRGSRSEKNKGRICIVTSEQLSTNPRVVKEADALADAGYDVRVVACQWMDWSHREDALLSQGRNWRCKIIDRSRELAPFLFWYSRIRHYLARRFVAPLAFAPWLVERAVNRIVPEIVRAAASEPANLFIGHNLPGLPAAVKAARAHEARSAFDAEDFHSGMGVSAVIPLIGDRLAEVIERRYLPHCEYVTAASPGIAQAYAERFMIKLPRVILNAFPLSERPKTFRPHNPKAPLTLYWFSQVIGARRGLEEIVRALAITQSRNIELHLRGQWQPGYREQLNQVAIAAGLQPTQIISHDLAPPKEMIRLASQYDVGIALEQPVSKNRDVCLTNKILTYLLAGNAVIATATTAQMRFMQTIPGAGLCYQIGDVRALARQLTEWDSDRAALERTRLRAWEYGQQTYNWEIEQQKLLDIVERTLATRCNTA